MAANSTVARMLAHRLLLVVVVMLLRVMAVACGGCPPTTRWWQESCRWGAHEQVGVCPPAD